MGHGVQGHQSPATSSPGRCGPAAARTCTWSTRCTSGSTFTDTLTAFQALVAKWPQANRKLVEDKANGTAVIDSLKSKIPGIVPVTPHESKYARANAVSPFVEAGNVWLPAPDVALFEVEAFIEEAAGFPNAAHDDQVDAASQALAELLLDGTGAQAWLEWAKRKAEAVAADRVGTARVADRRQGPRRRPSQPPR